MYFNDAFPFFMFRVDEIRDLFDDMYDRVRTYIKVFKSFLCVNHDDYVISFRMPLDCVKLRGMVLVAEIINII